MSILHDIEVTCPVCDTVFASTSIAAANQIGQDTDFRPRTLGADAVPHYVHVCPYCGFAAFEGDFDSVQDSVRDHVLGGGPQQHPIFAEEDPTALSGSSKYLLAAECYEHDSRATQMRLGDLCLRASWCARQEGKLSREQECRVAAILHFEEALARGEVGPEQEITMLYLTGELYRRLGRYELAVTVLQQAAEAIDEETESRLLDLIRRQREAALRHESGNMVIEV